MYIPPYILYPIYRFDIIGYGTTPADASYWRRSVEMSCDQFRDISHLSAEEACKLIRNDQVG
jgi:hypothetical protein